MTHLLGRLLIGGTIVAIGACSESTPPPPPVATVQVTVPSDSVLVGDSLQLTATTLDAQSHVLAGRTVTWTSSDTTIAKVSGAGLVHGVSAGSVTITAISEGIAGTAPLSVRQRFVVPGAPQNLQVSAGTSYNQLIIAWTSVPGATCYRLYWGTSPGVTPQTGTRIDVCELTFRHDSLTSHTTYYYLVTATNSAGEGPPSTEAHATASGDISINTLVPQAGVRSDTLLGIVVLVASRFQLSAVTAQVAGRSIDLTFVADTNTPNFSSTGPAWAGRLSLVGLPHGRGELTILVVDAFADTARQFVNFVYDQYPRLQVTAPIDYSVARPEIHVSATCTDDGATGCTLTVLICPYYCVVPVATAQGTIDQAVSLAECDGCGGYLEFRATDSAGQQTTATRQTFVESSPVLTDVTSVTGQILDVRPDRILWLDQSTSQDVLMLHDRASGQDAAIIGLSRNFTDRSAFLTPSGVLFDSLFTSHDGGVYQWAQGSLTNVGYAYAHTLVVKDSFALWNAGTTLVRRDLIAGGNVTVSDSANYATDLSNTPNDVANNGDVVFWSANSQIYRVRNGTTTRLSADSTAKYSYPRTDGINVVYTKADLVAVFDSVEHVLTPVGLPAPRYLTVNGWVAYTRLGSGGETQLWTRSPTGVEQQVTRFGTSSSVQALGPNGEVVLLNTFGGVTRRYLAVPDYSAPPRDIGSALGTPFFLNGTLFVRLGRTLFQLNP